MKIFISGAIGVGKTTLAELLSRELDLPIYVEPVDDNPVLPLFYENPKEYAFMLQIYFLSHRIKNTREMMAMDDYIADRSLYEDKLFFHAIRDSGRATDLQVTVYDEMDSAVTTGILEDERYRPDLMVFIDLSEEEMLRRIRQRGRDYEQFEDDPSLRDYYILLLKRYKEWIADYDASPKLIIDGNTLDLLNDSGHQEAVISQIKEQLGTIYSAKG
ncbi:MULTISPECIES: deoxynucleoside kinase [unclassified Enterococcus]|jgi:deoxyadenosine/deoxycytidine kinase|uniref:deoxynucleoside kinase n=1 Tax=unclassified Enterococcus TaxID=2608891 RepID=UPI000353D65E|nr:deoxynucleoside kinase [Enterococcus faecalis 13-SD-W-01]